MKKYFVKAIGWMRLHTLALAFVLLLGSLFAPMRVQGQLSPCCVILSAGLATINSTLSTVIGGGLDAINGVLTTIQQFEQQVVWPAQAIAQARGLVRAIQG